MKHFVIYTVLRLGLFLATYAVLSGIAVLLFGGDRSVFVVTLFLAAILSSFLSLKFLAGPRERFAQSVEARATRAKERFEEIRSREDVE